MRIEMRANERRFQCGPRFPFVDPVFPSKRDAWIVVVIWVAIAAMLAGASVMLGSPGPFVARVALAGFMLLSAGFSLWVTYGTRYRVTPLDIAVRSGPLRWRIPLEGIASIEPSNIPLSSPAVSLDRLRVVYRVADGRERAMLLSPADKGGFLAAVAARRPSLVLSGDRLVPRA
jgi:hypothetical protein